MNRPVLAKSYSGLRLMLAVFLAIRMDFLSALIKLEPHPLNLMELHPLSKANLHIPFAATLGNETSQNTRARGFTPERLKEGRATVADVVVNVVVLDQLPVVQLQSLMPVPHWSSILRSSIIIEAAAFAF